MDVLTLIVVGSVLAPIIIMLAVRRMTNGGGKKKRERAEQLMDTGAKGRASITQVTPTGTIVNQINLRCVVDFKIAPLDGSPTFTGQKKFLINQTQMPRIGDTWPCWYDKADRTEFAVGQPTGSNEHQIELFREFGIAHPLDASTGRVTGTSADQARLAQLEQLGELHSQGVLSQREFESEKRRILRG